MDNLTVTAVNFDKAEQALKAAPGFYTKKLGLSTDVDERIAIQSKTGQLYEDEVKDDKKKSA